jgi:hypothetical protein
MSEQGYLVAIADLKMPKNCEVCPLYHFYFGLNGVTIHHICKYRNMEISGDFKNKRNDFCPLIEVKKEEN